MWNHVRLERRFNRGIGWAINVIGLALSLECCHAKVTLGRMSASLAAAIAKNRLSNKNLELGDDSWRTCEF